MGKLDEQLQSSIRRQDGDGDVNSACLNDRSSARVGPPPRPGDACRRSNVGRMRGIVRARAKSTARAAWGKGWRVRVAPPERDPRGSGQHCFKELGRQRSCNAKRHAGSTAWRRAEGRVKASAGGTARQHRLDECGYTARKRHLDECGKPH